MKLVFFGSSHFVIPIIESLNKRFEIALVVTTEEIPQNEPLKILRKVAAVPLYCQQNNIPVLTMKQLNNPAILTIKKTNPDLGVLVYFGILLKPEILQIFPHGILNTHPSLLPKYRGTTPVQTAILNGDAKTGVSIIRLDSKMDHGPILAQKKENIKPQDTLQTLHNRLFTIGTRLLISSIPSYANGALALQKQDDSKATYTNPLTRQSGYVDPANPPTPQYLNRMIQAFYPWPGVWTKVVLRFHLDQGGTLQREKIIKLLPDGKIQMEGKKPMSYKDFRNGYPQAQKYLDKLLKKG